MSRPKPMRRFNPNTAGWLLAGPAALTLLVMLLAPSFMVLIMSFTDWRFGAKSFNLVGIQNYLSMAQDRATLTALGNTFFYALIVTPTTVIFGLVFALLIEAQDRFKSFFRAAWFMPVTVSMTAMSMVWEFIFHPYLGPLNQFLSLFGLKNLDWLGHPDLVLWAVCLVGIWEGVGFNLVVFLAGLQSIPKDLYDAAELDGASSVWDRFRVVTWPMLGPTSLFVFIISAIHAFKVFDFVAALTQGEPGGASEVILFNIYREGFQYFRMGHAAAMTVVFLAIVLALTLFKTWYFDKRVHYS